MANRVDPRIEQIPKAFLEKEDSRNYFENLERFLHDVYVKLGAGSDPIAATESDSNRKADTLLYAVLDKVSLGDPVTIDTTGFTVDTTNQYTDLTES